jgi:hypothetical protein
MSPEQYRGETADVRSDQFSFCVALYRALYKRPPFAGDTVAQLADSVLSGRLRPPPDDVHIPIEIWRALSRGLHTDPAQRFPSMSQLLAALDVDMERDPAGSWLARDRLSLVLGLFTVAAVALLGRRSLSVRNLLLLDALGLPFLIGGAVVLRRNAFHRSIMSLGIVAVAANFGVRGLALLLRMELRVFLAFDLMSMAASSAVFGLLYFRSLLYVAAVLFLDSFVILLWPQHATLLANAGSLLLISVFLYSWSRAARRSAGRSQGL